MVLKLGCPLEICGNHPSNSDVVDLGYSRALGFLKLPGDSNEHSRLKTTTLGQVYWLSIKHSSLHSFSHPYSPFLLYLPKSYPLFEFQLRYYWIFPDHPMPVHSHSNAFFTLIWHLAYILLSPLCLSCLFIRILRCRRTGIVSYSSFYSWNLTPCLSHYRLLCVLGELVMVMVMTMM